MIVVAPNLGLGGVQRPDAWVGSIGLEPVLGRIVVNLERLQVTQDAVSKLIRHRLPRWLAGDPGVDPELAWAAENWVQTVRVAVSDLPDGRRDGVRNASTSMLLDLVAASHRDSARAENWRKIAEETARGTKLEAVVHRIRDGAPWFRDAQALRWLYTLGRDQAELDVAEARFMELYAEPLARRYALG